MASIHTWKAREKAAKMGAFAGDEAALPLWELSKRELIEIALRLTMSEVPSEAVKQVQDEHQCLKANGLI